MLAIVLAVLQIYLSGHSLSLWGFGAYPERPLYHWPALLLVIVETGRRVLIR